MAQVDYSMKEGDLLPTFDVTLKDGTSNVDVSTGISGIAFFMRNQSTDVLKIDGGSMTYITDGTNGQVRYSWVSGNTNLVGKYNAEVVVTWTTDNKPQTFPNNKDIVIEVREDVED